jgi:hypothetical protein
VPVQIEITRSILLSKSERGTTSERSAFADILQTHNSSPLTAVHLQVAPYAKFINLSERR